MAVLLAQAGASAAGMQSPGQPPECSTIDGGRARNVWERAKAPELRRYCDLLASGASKLAGAAAMAKDVLLIADEADKALPGHAAPVALRGRALERLSRYPEALAELRKAHAIDERAFDDPLVLCAWARVLARTGHARDALAAYRSLLPRASALGVADRGPAYVEAGMLAMATGAAGLDEAVSILRQARRESQDVGQTLAVAALALALDREGQRAESRAELGDRPPTEVRAAVSDPRAAELVGPSGATELEPMLALALEPSDPRKAREMWQKYLQGAGSKGPWVEHARTHVAGAAKSLGRDRP